MQERVAYEISCGRPSCRTIAGREREQRFLRFLREPVEDSEQIVVAEDPAHSLEVDGWYAEAQEVVITLDGEERRRRVGLRRAQGDLLLSANNLLELDDLRRSSNGMRCDRPTLCPAIGRVMIIDIHQDVPIAVAKDDHT